MFELIRKSILATIGVAVITAEKVQEITSSLVREGKISTEEADRLANEFLKSGERQWDEMSTRIADSVKNALESLDLVRRKEFQDLRVKVELLEQRLILLEDAQRMGTGSSKET